MRKQISIVLSLAVLIGLLAGGQYLSFWVTKLNREKKQAESNYEITAELLDNKTKELRATRIRHGELWAGELHPPNESAIDCCEKDTSQSEIAGQRMHQAAVPVGTDGLLGTVNFHECNPGSKSCGSGGDLKLADPAGNLILTATLNLLQEGRSSYEINWPNQTLPEQEKITLLQRAVGENLRLDEERLFSIVSQLYGYRQGEARSEDLTRELIGGILSTAVRDRINRAAAR